MVNPFRAIWASVLASRADTLASNHERFIEALEVLEQAYKLLGLSVPSKSAPVDWNIMASQIAISAQNSFLALRCCEEALQQIKSGISGYTGEDRKYVEAFCLAIQEYCLVWRDGDGALRVETILDVDFRRVRKYLKWRFRLPPEGTFLSPLEGSGGNILH
jgi:hypothetical protein